MQILILSPWVPSPTWGAATRTFQFVRLLARRHEVTLVSYAETEDAAQETVLRGIAQHVELIPRQTTLARKRVDQLTALTSRTSFQWRNMQSPVLQAALDRLCRERRFDIIQVESSQLAGLSFDPRPALILDEHNVEYELLRRMYETETSPLRRFYNWAEYRKFRNEERRAWRQAAGILTTSAREEAIVRQALPGAATLTAPNAVDVDFFTPDDTPVDPNAIVLTGLMKYRPNVDAAQFFVRDILPRVLSVRPQATFSIVGGSPPEEVEKLAGPNVIVTGTVPDVRPYVNKAAVFVVPLRMGSGTRLKVLEGLSMRKAMVSTALGCEGIEVEDGRHLIVADEADAFAAAVLRLMDDRALAQRLASEGRALVDRRYRWDSIVATVEAFFETVLSARRPVPR